MLYRILIFLILLVTWTLFSGQLDWFHLTLGVISAGFVTWISGDLLFDDRESNLTTRLKQGCRMASYLLWLLWQVVLSNIHLVRLAFGNQKDIQPSIVCFQTALKSDFEKFMLANSITLTPGTITIKIDGDRFCVHAISEKTALSLTDPTMENRIAGIFRDDSKPREDSGS